MSLDEAASLLGGDGCIVCAFYQPTASLAAARARVQAHSGIETFTFLPLMRALPELASNYWFDSDRARAQDRADRTNWLFGRLADDESRQVLENELKLRLDLEPIDDYQPSPPMSAVSGWPGAAHRINFVDCGAYDGDTVAAFIEHSPGGYERIHALEPDPRSYARLLARVGAMPATHAARIVTYPLGVWDQSGTQPFAGDGTAASALHSAGSGVVGVVALDDLLAPDANHLIKLDVEGAEARALRGAQRTLANGRNGVAVSLYHRPDDIVELPRLVDDLVPNARFLLRSHGFDGADLTLYAFPPGV